MLTMTGRLLSIHPSIAARQGTSGDCGYGDTYAIYALEDIGARALEAIRTLPADQLSASDGDFGAMFKGSSARRSPRRSSTSDKI